MSHLRPIHPTEPERAKRNDELTPSERLHIVTQIEDDHKNATAVGRKLSDETLAFAHTMSKGTERENNVDLPPAPAQNGKRL